MIQKKQSLLNWVACVSVIRLPPTSTNPASVVIPQAIALENYCFTTSSHKPYISLFLIHEHKYPLKPHIIRLNNNGKIITAYDVINLSTKWEANLNANYKWNDKMIMIN